jgi:hypothetical protein
MPLAVFVESQPLIHVIYLVYGVRALDDEL